MTRLVAWSVGRYEGEIFIELLEKIKSLGFMSSDRYPGLEWRSPKENHNMIGWNDSALSWHRDGGGLYVSLLVWSNREPTEVKDARTDQIVGPFKPGDIILIRNGLALHRMPRWISTDRYFARMYDV